MKKYRNFPQAEVIQRFRTTLGGTHPAAKQFYPSNAVLHRRYALAASNIVHLLLILLCICACGSATGVNTLNENGSTDPRVISETGIHCSVDDRSPLPGTLILDTNHLSYDTVTIQNVAQYVDDAHDNIDLPPLPSGFSLVNVSLPQRIQAWHIGTIKQACAWTLQITNMDGQKTIQVGQVQMQIQTQPVKERYSLVDVCSLPLAERQCVPGQIGGGVNYTYQFDLTSNQESGVITGQPVVADQPLATLQPDQTVEIDAIFTAPANASSIAYLVTPEITIEMAGEQRLVVLNTMKTTITLVSAKQLSCYTLHGNTFEPLSPQTQQTAWCL